MCRKLIYTFFVLFLVEVTTSQVVDYSPYCDPLARITTLCSQWTIQMICPKTCQIEHILTKKCGNGAPSSRDFQGLRKKRFDEELKDEVLQEQREGMNYRVRRVVGGKPSAKGAFPWHVALYHNGRQTCNGAILSPDWILTTAHCFNRMRGTSDNPSEWVVVAGEHSMFTKDQNEEKAHVKKIIIHKDYHQNIPGPNEERKPDDYDVALLKLEHPLPLNIDISPICVSEDLSRFTSKDDCRVMGWGKKSKKGWHQKELHEAKVKIVPHDICNLPLSYNGTIHKRAICAGYRDGSADACDNDSGGSLACNINQRWYGVGLVSFGFKCGSPTKYGVFTNVPMMKSWIIQTILNYDDATNSVLSMFERMATLIPRSYPRAKNQQK